MFSTIINISKLPASRTHSAEHQHCQLLGSLRHILHSANRLRSPFITLPCREGSSWAEIQDGTCITAEDHSTGGSVPRISTGCLSWVHLSLRQTPTLGMRQEMTKKVPTKTKGTPSHVYLNKCFQIWQHLTCSSRPNHQINEVPHKFWTMQKFTELPQLFFASTTRNALSTRQ